MEFENIPVLLNKVPTKVWEDGDEMFFQLEDETVIRFYHKYRCCENVSIEDIAGDLQDLVGSPLVMAEMASEYDESDSDRMFTFYKFATEKGYVTVRWLGVSDHYSVEVSMEIQKPITKGGK